MNFCLKNSFPDAARSPMDRQLLLFLHALLQIRLIAAAPVSGNFIKEGLQQQRTCLMSGFQRPPMGCMDLAWMQGTCIWCARVSHGMHGLYMRCLGLGTVCMGFAHEMDAKMSPCMHIYMGCTGSAHLKAGLELCVIPPSKQLQRFPQTHDLGLQRAHHVSGTKCKIPLCGSRQKGVRNGAHCCLCQ